jgi:hypothetical protein
MPKIPQKNARNNLFSSETKVKKKSRQRKREKKKIERKREGFFCFNQAPHFFSNQKKKGEKKKKMNE